MYRFLDSGEGQRLEQFGDRVLARPCKLAMWKRRKEGRVWQTADAEYDHDRGWKIRGKPFSEWELALPQITLQLRLQDNGQIGFFPEHMSYFEDIKSALSGGSKKVLNLFAYTGMATALCARQGAQVTHVEIAKKVMDWASVNFSLNGLAADAVRLIKDDAVEFLRRECRRKNRYDLIIADPPSFSRLSNSKSWNLEECIVEIVANCCELLSQERGTLLLTNHHFETGGQVLANLVHDAGGDSFEVCNRELALKESDSARTLPAGFLVVAQRKGFAAASPGI